MILPKLTVRRWWHAGLVAGVTLLLLVVIAQVNWLELVQPLEANAFRLEDRYRHLFPDQQALPVHLLLLLAFGGGLIASISPCVLSLLPVNLTYIGTREITSRRDALLKASGFALGVMVTFCSLGLFAAFAATVFVSHRGYVLIAVGSFALLMALVLLGIVRLPVLSVSPRWAIAGPFGVGLAFALASSPCSSPLLFTVLAMAAATQSPLLSVLTMASYAVGYALLIFLASLGTGLAKRTRILLRHSTTIVRLSSLLLLVLGGYYIVDGTRWLLSAWQVQ
ncbi:MAG: cytochrome c biogenesis protein CcdA [Spirulinaceae cyanobacterium RM2_2_10]|nr:cytochrome c biogenesis protein CcdA [Spirulinaceae cyanobacterium SM2_1_0]NJO19894.1 cytochrome c biogenesis protein CcdA [Spirulinaceae cyanobacterium RM2_2_10]